MKPQAVRLADVLLIGPLMIWGGAKTRAKNPILGTALFLFGLATISYNYSNYCKTE
jgi:hypothetical protein